MFLRIKSRQQGVLVNSLQASRLLSASKELTTLNSKKGTNKTLDSDISGVQTYVETSRDTAVVWGTTIIPSNPELPANPSEVSALDPAHSNQDMPSLLTGEKRCVRIKQDQAQVSQSPLSIEQKWVISFQDDGETAQCWENPLMGWVSSADPIANNMRLQMQFPNASDAVYFAKKRGWDYLVEKPIYRKVRDDGAQYQDNFLPQHIAARVKREGSKCDHWYRESSGTSHYYRPLKYHGDGYVSQHGPNGDKKIDPHIKKYYARK